MIDYIKDMLVPGKITTFPYKMTGPIAIASRKAFSAEVHMSLLEKVYNL